MKCHFRTFILFYVCGIAISCQPTQTDLYLSKEEMLKIVRKNDALFSEGVRTKNAEILAHIYTDSAQYVQPDRPILDRNGQHTKRMGKFYWVKGKTTGFTFEYSRGSRGPLDHI